MPWLWTGIRWRLSAVSLPWQVSTLRSEKEQLEVALEAPGEGWWSMCSLSRLFSLLLSGTLRYFTLRLEDTLRFFFFFLMFVVVSETINFLGRPYRRHYGSHGLWLMHWQGWVAPKKNPSHLIDSLIWVLHVFVPCFTCYKCYEMVLPNEPLGAKSRNIQRLSCNLVTGLLQSPRYRCETTRPTNRHWAAGRNQISTTLPPQVGFLFTFFFHPFSGMIIPYYPSCSYLKLPTTRIASKSLQWPSRASSVAKQHP